MVTLPFNGNFPEILDSDWLLIIVVMVVTFGCKAFDHVNHAIIPTICSFLCNRKQTVRYHGKAAEEDTITCGVPQGTRLGSILFFVLVNDASVDCANRWKYVDDLTLVEILKKSQPSQLQSNVDALVQWCNSNDVVRQPPPPIILDINSNTLEVVSSLKLLRISLQNNLKWDEQVSRLISNASRRLYILTKLRRNGVNAKDLAIIYKMYIRPTLEFAAPVWTSGITCDHSACIERVQRRAFRSISYPNIKPYDQ
ncbi:uncharacterized protein LOC135156958 [Lytechinus pictus]|uniref:uncharacterized protein LOC135156958 n=1 Tax=Lytechinus pictus TaxID=7653 RepID=UPI0030BA1C33